MPVKNNSLFGRSDTAGTVINVVSVTGATTVVVSGTTAVSGSVSVINTSSTILIGTSSVTGSVTIINPLASPVPIQPPASGYLVISGSTSVINAVTITGNTSIIGTLNITGSVVSLPDSQVKLTDGTDIADILDLTNSNPLTVAIVDGSGTQITSFGGGTQYAEATTAATITGTAVMVEDSGDTLRVVPGDATKGMKVQITDGSGTQITSFGGGTQYTEGDTDATITGTAMLMEGAANALVVAQGTVADGLLVNLGTNNDVTVTGSVSITGSTSVINTVAITGSTTVVSCATHAVTQSGTWTITGSTAVVGTVTITGNTTILGTVTVTGTTISVGNIAHDTGDSGNPVKIGGYAKTYGSLPTAVTDADRVNALYDRYGSAFVQIGSPFVKTYNATYSSAQTNTAIVTVSTTALRVYGLIINMDYDSTAITSIRIGFGATTTPTTTAFYETNGIVPGNYSMAFPAPVVGASGDDIRITSTDPTGNLNVIIFYDEIAI